MRPKVKVSPVDDLRRCVRKESFQVGANCGRQSLLDLVVAGRARRKPIRRCLDLPDSDTTSFDAAAD